MECQFDPTHFRSADQVTNLLTNPGGQIISDHPLAPLDHRPGICKFLKTTNRLFVIDKLERIEFGGKCHVAGAQIDRRLSSTAQAVTTPAFRASYAVIAPVIAF